MGEAKTEGQRTSASFCGVDERVSDHTCNSLYPAVSVDTQGNQSIVWHDNRDGNFEIYFRSFPSLLSDKDALDLFGRQSSGTRLQNLQCVSGVSGLSGVSGFSHPTLSEICDFSGIASSAPLVLLTSTGETIEVEPGETVFRLQASRIVVSTPSNESVTTDAVTLETPTEIAEGMASDLLQSELKAYLYDKDLDFVDMGVKPGSRIRFLSGLNSGRWAIVEAVSIGRLQLVFDPAFANDEDVTYLLDIGSGSGDPSSPLSGSRHDTCEIRVTCNSEPSLFPDVVADKWCRSHIVWHDKASGSDQIYYSQVGYKNFMAKCDIDGVGAAAPAYLGDGSWEEANLESTNLSDEFYYFSDVDGSVTRAYDKSGPVAQRVSYGTRAKLPTGGAGLHTLYRGDPDLGETWVGLSKHYDREAWEDEILEVSAEDNPTPPIVKQTSNDVFETGDFGSQHSFGNLSFQVQTPPDLGVEVEFIRLPLVPKCLPRGTAKAGQLFDREANIVEAPRRPLPPSFVDPIDVSTLLQSPLVSEDSDLPPRFVLDSDPTGTVYTNMVQEDSRGKLNRIVFTKQEEGDDYKFLLSFRQCGDGACAVKPSEAFDSTTEVKDAYRIRLAVYRGPDYRLNPDLVGSASHETEKVFEKTFALIPDEDWTVFSFSPGELVLDRGSIYFVVPEFESGFGVMTRGITSSSSSPLWYDNGGGEMVLYSTPYAVPPYDGLSVPVYYEGHLTNAPRKDTEAPSAPLVSEVPEELADQPQEVIDEFLGSIGTINEQQVAPSDVQQCSGEGKLSNPILLTASQRENHYPSIALTPSQNAWLVWQSTRNGTPDIYAARFFGACSTWNSSATGGQDLQVTSFSDGGRGSAKFPSVVSDGSGNAHVVFQVEDPATGRSQVWYAKGTWSGRFAAPVRLTDSPGNAVMPDIAVSYADDGVPLLNVVWHDSRYGNWEVMTTVGRAGNWDSSAHGGQDLRVTSSGDGDSMFPRIASDKDGNLRVVFHSNRTGKTNIYMASYSVVAKRWLSSASGLTDTRISQGPDNSMFADVAEDGTGGLAVVWHDDRHLSDSPDHHEEVYLSYCPQLGHPGTHFTPLVSNIEHKLNFDFEVIDCQTAHPIEVTNTEDVCLRVDAPNATFWRASNEQGGYGDWAQFNPNVDSSVMVTPWTLSCGNGAKQVNVQVQDQDLVSFPITKTVSLIKPPEKYKVEMFSDADMTESLPRFGPYYAAKAGDVYVRITTPTLLAEPPAFDVIQKGSLGIFNQQTQVQASQEVVGFNADQVDTGEASLIMGSDVFVGRFEVSQEDGLYHRDGLARVIIRPRNKCESKPSSLDAPEAETDNIQVPEAPETTPQWPTFGGTASWVAQVESLPLSSSELSVAIDPTRDSDPFNFTFGAIAQPFTLAGIHSGDAVFNIQLASRELPEWLSDFGDRVIKVSVIQDFLSSPSTVASVEVKASELAEVSLDVVSGLLEDPASAADMPEYEVLFPALSLPAGTHALALEDEQYPALVAEYGANAKLFTMTVGTDVPAGESPYYLRDF